MRNLPDHGQNIDGDRFPKITYGSLGTANVARKQRISRPLDQEVSSTVLMDFHFKSQTTIKELASRLLPF
jgi:hypothetical protein